MSKVSIKLFTQPVFVVRNIMSQTEALFTSLSITFDYQASTFNHISSFWNIVLRPVNRSIVFLSCFPNIRMMFMNMFTVAIAQFKIFYSIVSFDAINMMDSFFLSKFSTYVLLNNISVMKNTLTTWYGNTEIPKFSKMWLTFLEQSPTRRYKIVISMPIEPSSMHFAYFPVFNFENIITSFNVALISNHYPHCIKL